MKGDSLVIWNIRNSRSASQIILLEKYPHAARNQRPKGRHPFSSSSRTYDYALLPRNGNFNRVARREREPRSMSFIGEFSAECSESIGRAVETDR